MQRHFARFLKSVKCLGLRNGAQIYYYYVLHRLLPARLWTPRRVSVNSISRPIWLRPGVSDWIALERIFFDKEYDPSSEVHNNALQGLESKIAAAGKTPLIIDCGANIGLSAIWFAERFPRSTILAIEPERRNFEILQSNAAVFANIVPINAAVSDRISRVDLVNERDVPWSWRTIERQDGAIETVTIPALLARYSDHRLFMVKMDIEGFETIALKAGDEWIDELPAMIFEMHDWMRPWSGSGHAFFSLLAHRQRDYLIKGENIFALSAEALS